MADDDREEQGKSPAFQFYPKDFITDENVRLMSLQERGAYITLICLCWLDGTLPSDLSVIARTSGIPVNLLRKMWPALARCFRDSQDLPGRLVHPRLEKERIKQIGYRRRQSDNGKLGGRPRNPEKPKPFENKSQSIESQTEAKKSSAFTSSSPISDLQSTSPVRTIRVNSR